MTQLKNELGTITYSDEVIGKLAGRSIEQCYGIVGMAAKRATDGIVELLNRENYTRGIIVRRSEAGGIILDLYVMVQYGNPILTVAESAASTVKYNVESNTGLSLEKINVIVEGIRI